MITASKSLMYSTVARYIIDRDIFNNTVQQIEITARDGGRYRIFEHHLIENLWEWVLD